MTASTPQRRVSSLAGIVPLCLALVACATGGAGPVAPQAPPATTAAGTSSAVASLLAEARLAVAAGQPERAASSIERAMRIERRNPELYLELARIRLEQGQAAQAESLALKAAALAPASLQARSWQTVAQARRAAGDMHGAQLADERARQAAEH